MFQLFERLVEPYPDTTPVAPPKSFFAFLWECTRGLRPYLVAMMLFTAAVGVIEALLFSMIGRVVDWLAKTDPARLWEDNRTGLLLLMGMLVLSPLLVSFQALFKHQAMMGNFPMRLRWNFHRLMLAQSMTFAATRPANSF